MKKKEILFFLPALAVALALVGLTSLMGKDGKRVRIQVDGQELGIYDLDQDQIIDIPGTGTAGNRLQIREGGAAMIYADCPDQICVRQGRIRETTETIVCLPNKVFVEVVEE